MTDFMSALLTRHKHAGTPVAVTLHGERPLPPATVEAVEDGWFKLTGDWRWHDVERVVQVGKVNGLEAA